MFGIPFLPAVVLAICPYSGLEGRTAVPIPRLAEADVAIDGALSEPVWGAAAVLCGFSEYAPVDGRPADDSTAVQVWYSPHAIYVGIRAFEHHGAVHAAQRIATASRTTTGSRSCSIRSTIAARRWSSA